MKSSNSVKQRDLGEEAPIIFLRLPDVLLRVGLSRSGLYQLIQEGKFPRPYHLSANRVGWLEGEITAWQRDRIAERDRSKAA